ncbi:TetR/AcrR family transcriptional regulator [Nocardia sp. NPDC101769]|uniref:TetR/AcrR family transcriptional regulator n=1 Tax=Nocardia sp. NPDC101769 TaxID=3364333 RepID=UPI00382CD76D
MRDVQRLRAGSDARQARAERILDVTAELLQVHGYRRVTVDDVAKRAGIGKGTIYLHWRTREALLWAVLQRETGRLMDRLITELSDDAELALPHRLMTAIFLEVSHRPLVKALLLSDVEILGTLAQDEAVAAAQQELAGNKNYFEMVRDQGLLRADLGVDEAGCILDGVIRGFFAATESPEHTGLSLDERAGLLAYVLRRTLENDTPPPVRAVQALSVQVIELFRAIAASQHAEVPGAH